MLHACLVRRTTLLLSVVCPMYVHHVGTRCVRRVSVFSFFPFPPYVLAVYEAPWTVSIDHLPPNTLQRPCSVSFRTFATSSWKAADFVLSGHKLLYFRWCNFVEFHEWKKHLMVWKELWGMVWGVEEGTRDCVIFYAKITSQQRSDE